MVHLSVKHFLPLLATGHLFSGFLLIVVKSR